MLELTKADVNISQPLINRLKSIEGQARGIQRMLDDSRNCREIIDQLMALRAAANAVTLEAVQAFSLHCLRSSEESAEDVLTELLGVIAKLTR
jgi:CsoR family transcriptional regulator, copper-sensing transcriptional repressor